MKIIHLKDAMSGMETENPFSITFVTCDTNRKTGGDMIKLENVILSFHQKNARELGFEKSELPVTEFSKNPNHYTNATRNVLLQNGMRRKFHIRLLLEFNGQKVFY
jgi:hypothetical protein